MGDIFPYKTRPFVRFGIKNVKSVTEKAANLCSVRPALFANPHTPAWLGVGVLVGSGCTFLGTWG